MNISEYIATDLESKIRARADLPPKFTLHALSESYGVSATPVRRALDTLIEKGLVAKEPNGRLRVKRAQGRPRKMSPPLEPTDWEAVLGREVLLMSLRGGEPFVREEAMAERHGIGRTLLRRVFHRLAGGGLLQHVPRRGWQVPRFDEREMDAYIDVRETLEVKALDLARTNLDPSDLDRMIAGNAPEQIAAVGIDNELHAYFIERSLNRYIAAFFDINGRYYNALFDYATVSAEMVSEMANQHLDVLHAARACHWAKARRALGHHIRSQKPVMQAMLERFEQAPAARPA